MAARPLDWVGQKLEEAYPNPAERPQAPSALLFLRSSEWSKDTGLLNVQYKIATQEVVNYAAGKLGVILQSGQRSGL